ncbi:lysozyme inhibitor LprI family protein [Cupriavidus sp. amp6]|uniref:lysozyme inhibitor LprI family protein n=1 Tax=Cupriavidus sp. amp6 TaxID=388051 RepID=UPI0006844457|nr:lysozyme inhibitor LprI family protein [Cupriavidus sp. amp6]
MKFRHLILALLIVSPLAHATSFDCKKASTFAEKTICASSLLGKLDDALTENYSAMLATDLGDGGASLKKEQRAWISQRNKCTTEQCLIDLYRKRVDDVCEAPVVSGMHAACVQSSDIKAGPTTLATQGGSQPATAQAKDNPVIESWMKSCMPFAAPADLDGQIRAGNVAFRGVKVSAVDTADAGASSLVSVRLDVPAADFKAKNPDLAKTVKFPKSKTCPAGVQRSMTGAKGATIECNCFTGGD